MHWLKQEAGKDWHCCGRINGLGLGTSRDAEDAEPESGRPHAFIKDQGIDLLEV